MGKNKEIIMINRDKETIQEKLDLLASGNFRKDSVEILLIRIRDYISNKNSSLKEITHFVAHSDRNQGVTYDETLKKTTEMLKIFKSGGELVVEPIFFKDYIYKEFLLFCHKYKFNFDETKLKNFEGLFFDSLFEFLDKVEIKISHSDIDSIIFINHCDTENHQQLSFNVKFNKNIAGIVNLKKEVSVALPLFD